MGSIATAETWFVDQTNGNNGSVGDDWPTAFATLQRAFDENPQAGDIILVAEGIYHPSVRADACDPLSATFTLPLGVAIHGGFPEGGADFEDRDPSQYITILSGDLSAAELLSGCPNSEGGDCFTTSSEPGCTDCACCDAVCCIEPFCCSVEWDRSCVELAEVAPACASATKRAYHVVTAPEDTTPATILDGFTITLGRATGTGLDGVGGGLFVAGVGNHTGRNISPTIVRCQLIENEAGLGGAA